MSPREIMNDQDTNENVFNQNADLMPEISSASVEDELIYSESKKERKSVDSKNDYADSFPDWDLLPPQVEIRRVSHRQS